MTTNQIIVLLDVHRGFTSHGHAGTLKQDLEYLERKDLIKGVAGLTFDWELTAKGTKVVEVLKTVASIAEIAEK